LQKVPGTKFLTKKKFQVGSQLTRVRRLYRNVRYVLVFGLIGVIVAFIALGIYYGLGDKADTAPDSVTTPPASEGAPATGQ
jgi:NhaP-type Na+/H+ or K+/H+ antiporter